MFVGPSLGTSPVVCTPLEPSLTGVGCPVYREETRPDRRLFTISVDLLVPLETPYPREPVRGDVSKEADRDNRDKFDLETENS